MNKKLYCCPDKKSTKGSEDSPSEEEDAPSTLCLTLGRVAAEFSWGGLGSPIVLMDRGAGPSTHGRLKGGHLQSPSLRSRAPGLCASSEACLFL